MSHLSTRRGISSLSR